MLRQVLATERREAVAADVPQLAAAVDVDLAPAGEATRDLRIGRAGSAASKATSVSSENTTPKPNVSSAALRSQTVTSCPSRVNRIAEYRPPGRLLE